MLKVEAIEGSRYLCKVTALSYWPEYNARMRKVPGARLRKEERPGQRDLWYWEVPTGSLDDLEAVFPDNEVSIYYETPRWELLNEPPPPLPSYLTSVTPRQPKNFKLPLYPYQAYGAAFMVQAAEENLARRGRGYAFLCDDMGLGKAQPLDAKILTPSGWKLMADIKVGDRVIGSDGKPTEVLAVFPQGLRPIYRVTFSDGSSVECDEEHVWAVTTPYRRWKGLPPKHLTLRQIMDRGLKEYVSTRPQWPRSKWFIPMVQPVEFEPRTRPPIDPYVLGCLLGDGNLTYHTPELTSKDADLLAEVESKLPAGVTLKRVDSSKYHYRLVADRQSRTITGQFQENPITKALRDLGIWGRLSEEKFIPEIYKFGSVETRLGMLQGLLDTDGHVRPADNHIEFTTTSQQLAEDVQFIVESLGGTCTIHTKQTHYTLPDGARKSGRPAWILSIALPTGSKPFRLKRKADTYCDRQKYQPYRAIEAIEYVGMKPAQCILVAAADHLYVTDHCIVTHNTPQALAAVQLLIEDGKVSSKPGEDMVLVLGLSVAKIQWIRDGVERFTDHPGLAIKTMTPAARKKIWQSWPGYKYISANYDLLLLKDDAQAIFSIPWKAVILDEPHQKLMSWDGKMHQAVKSLIQDLDIPYVFLLTGTPVQARPEDLASLHDLVDPTRLGDQKTFNKNHVVWEWQGSFVKPVAYRNMQSLRQMTERYILRRTDQEVEVERPEGEPVNLDVEMTPLQRKLDELIAERRKELRAQADEIWEQCRGNEEKVVFWKGQTRKAKEFLEMLDGAMQGLLAARRALAIDPEWLKDSESGWVIENLWPILEKEILKGPLKAPKLELLMDQLKQRVRAEGEKVVIFLTSLKGARRLYRMLAREFGRDALAYFVGGMNDETRQQQVDRFMNDPTCQIMIANDAARSAVNLQTAKYMYHLDLCWNKTDYLQRVGRIKRVGSKHKRVHIFNLITSGSIDEDVLAAWERKTLVSAALTGVASEQSAALDIAMNL